MKSAGRNPRESSNARHRSVRLHPRARAARRLRAADKVIQKYQTSTCEQLKAQKDEPKSDKEKLAIDFLKNDTRAADAFIDKVAAPVARKMFACGLIP